MAIKIKLSELLGKKRIRAAQLSRDTDIDANTISRLYNEKVQGVGFNTLDKICEALECEIEDLLEYVPSTPKTARGTPRIQKRASS